MAPKITFIGGGSYQWTSKLLIALVNMPSRLDAHVVLDDIDPAPIPLMIELVQHTPPLLRSGLLATTPTHPPEALDGPAALVGHPPPGLAGLSARCGPYTPPGVTYEVRTTKYEQ